MIVSTSTPLKRYRGRAGLTPQCPCEIFFAINHLYIYHYYIKFKAIINISVLFTYISFLFKSLFDTRMRGT